MLSRYFEMIRKWGFFLSILLLSLASGASRLSLETDIPKQFVPLEDFENLRYSLGDYSSQIAHVLLAPTIEFEGNSDRWNCFLEFGMPQENFVNWIHPTDLRCTSEGEDYIWPLGEGEFRKAYNRGRILIQGEAAKKLSDILNQDSDSRDVESPISSRVIQWGPSNLLKITSLRRSSRVGDLHFSIECYVDEKARSPISCALEY